MINVLIFQLPLIKLSTESMKIKGTTYVNLHRNALQLVFI